jgi:hypothetical protein
MRSYILKAVMILVFGLCSTMIFADGSTTLPDGSIQSTVTMQSGAVQTTITYPDGSSVESTPQGDGTTQVVSKDPSGNVTSSTSVATSDGQ